MIQISGFAQTNDHMYFEQENFNLCLSRFAQTNFIIYKWHNTCQISF
jgi:hypothetical protein